MISKNPLSALHISRTYIHTDRNVCAMAAHSTTDGGEKPSVLIIGGLGGFVLSVCLSVCSLLEVSFQTTDVKLTRRATIKNPLQNNRIHWSFSSLTYTFESTGVGSPVGG